MARKIALLVGLLAASCLVWITCLVVKAQTDSDRKVTGVVRTKSGEIIPGLNLFVDSGTKQWAFLSDENGEFTMALPNGDYRVTANSQNSRDFQLFLHLVDGSPAPTDLVLTFDPATTCCSATNGTPYPQPTSLSSPKYPPAARAVRARGEVTVRVTIAPGGDVLAADAINGHPLLKKAAEAAAKSSKFEATMTGESREAMLTYVFLGNENTHPDVIRYQNPFRIYVFSGADILNTVNG